MNLIYIAFLWGDSGSFIGGVLFCITHAFLSSMMFFLVDCIQRRYKTRIISEITGILHTTPNLGIAIIFTWYIKIFKRVLYFFRFSKFCTI
jgi:formate hydrogenlyase subunit 3/multisubunit Na+/H+ antiporter MnhD subunit